MIRSATALVVLAICAQWLSPLYATQITYNVDVGGLSTDDSHPLRVQGTVLFDTAIASLVSSNLKFYHGGGGPGRAYTDMTSLPTESLGQDAYWHWLATPTELRFVTDQDSNGIAGVSWHIDIIGFLHTYGSFGMSQYGFSFYREFWWEPKTGDDVDWVSIIAPPTFGGDGMLFGTAVPEPATLALATLGGLGLLIATRRKR